MFGLVNSSRVVSYKCCHPEPFGEGTVHRMSMGLTLHGVGLVVFGNLLVVLL